MGVTARLDGFQRRHAWLGFPLAVVYKFVDDQGGYLAVLITYYGFVSLFPGLLLLISVLGYTLQSHPDWQQEVLGSALQQFPIVGPQLQQNVSSIHGSSVGVLLGILGAIYGGLGVSVAIQTALNRVWAVPRFARPDPVLSRLRGLVLFVLIGAVVLITTALAAVGPVAVPRLRLRRRHTIWGDRGRDDRQRGCVSYRLSGVDRPGIPLADLMPGAVAAGVAVEVLQIVGALFVSYELSDSSQIYGVFGLVLGLLAWLYLQAVVVVFCAEINVVRARRLWPRNLLTPFVNDVALTRADRASYRSYVDAERFTPSQQVQTTFDRQSSANDKP